MAQKSQFAARGEYVGMGASIIQVSGNVESTMIVQRHTKKEARERR